MAEAVSRGGPGGGSGGYAEPVALSGSVLWLGLFVLALANFMALLDMSIANVAVPNIAGGLAVSPNQGTWVITSYAVAEAITVPLTGWLARRYGTVRVFVTAMASFGICSALCGLAPSLGALVFFRILQGLSGGPMMPLSQTLLMRISPPHLRSQAMGLWVMTTVLAPVAGPLVGGSIADSWGWPWAFYVNVPIAAVCSFMAMRLLRAQETPVVKDPFDYIGMALLVVWIGAMQLMLDKGKELDWFNSPFIVGLCVTAVIGFAAFVIWELTDPHPVVDLRIFRYRGFSLGVVVMCVAYGAYFSSIVIVPLWLQTNLGYTARWAGYATAFNGVLMVVMGPIVARLSDKIDARPMISFGLLWVAGTMLLRTSFASNIDFGHVIVPQVLQGLGMPFFFIPVFSLALWPLKPQEYAAGAGLLTFARTTSGAFAVSLVTTTWDNASSVNRVAIVSRISNETPDLHALAVPGLSVDQSLRTLESLVQSQSVMAATNHVFEIVALMLAIAASFSWLAPKPERSPGQAGGH